MVPEINKVEIGGKMYNFEKKILHEVDVHFTKDSGFGRRNVEATKITNPNGDVSYVIILEKV